MIKNILTILLLFSFGLVYSQAPLLFSARLNVTNITGSDPYTLTGVVQDELSLWSAADINAANDSIYHLEGSDLLIYRITSISSASGNNFVIVVDDIMNSGLLPSTGNEWAAIEFTTNSQFPTYIGNLSSPFKSVIDNRFKQRLDNTLNIKLDSLYYGTELLVDGDTIPEDRNGIYGGDGTTPADVDVSITDSIRFSTMLYMLEGLKRLGIHAKNPIAPLHAYGQTLVESSGASAGVYVIRNMSANHATPTAPTNTASWCFSSGGWDGTNYTTIRKASLRFTATENWTSTANGTQIELAVVPNTTVTPVSAIRIFEDQSVLIKPGTTAFHQNALTNPATLWIVGRTSGSEIIRVVTQTNDSLMVLYTTGVNKLHKYGLGNFTASSLSKTKSDYEAIFATDGTIVEGNISNGVYVPTATKNTATDTIVTIYTHLYSRNDTVMNVSGRLLVNSVAGTTATSVQLTLPPGFTSDFTSRVNDITGSVTCRTTSGAVTAQAAWPEADTSTDRIVINWIADGVEATRQEINFNINLRKI